MPVKEATMLQLERIRVQHDGNPILRDVDLSVAKGEKIWIHGPSGSGKTTLLKVLFCAEYFEGRLLHENRPVTPPELTHYRSHLGFVSQRIPDFDLTVGEVLRYPLQFRANRHRSFPQDRAMELLAQLHFKQDVLSRRFPSLSGGEKQRLMVLLLLLVNRPVFLLDEVTAALDPENIENVVRLLTASPGRTVISVSHNRDWETFSTRSLFMQSGSLQAE